MKRLRLVTGLLMVLSVAPIRPTPSWADLPPSPVANIVARVEPSVVRIISVQPPQKPAAGDQAEVKDTDGHPQTAIGSGFIVDPSGLILTNKHVVANAVSIFVGTSDGDRYRAEAVELTGKADIALLRIHAGRKLPALTFADSDKVRVGDSVIAIGSPFGFDESVTSGIVSAVNRDIMESPFDDYIQTDAAINHGNSGGPLFDLAGDVIGMNSVIYAPGTGSVGVGFAIPSNQLWFVVDRIKKYGEVRAGMLPIRTQAVTGLMAQAIGAPGPGGALVAELEPQADQMHNAIRPGDVIRTFNGDPVLDPRNLARKAAFTEVGTQVTLGLSRGATMSSVVVPILPLTEQKLPLPGQSPPPTTLGLQFAAASGHDQASGVTVEEIEPSGSVADSGLQKGDVIVQVEQQAVSTPEQAVAALAARVAAKQPYAAVLVRRDGKESWIPIGLPG
ncbi:trypsin-like peptidase domain-containing protein [Rhodopila sp.]|uniref:trypsin-like peptidase domain-containing protein n=1 Tax=Rhodopila sp. TaxID=2480087 RepID=UPI003D099F42